MQQGHAPGKVFAVQGGCIQELSGWAAMHQIETDGPWRIGDIAELLASEHA
jgi:hypothetical protein